MVYSLREINVYFKFRHKKRTLKKLGSPQESTDKHLIHTKLYKSYKCYPSNTCHGNQTQVINKKYLPPKSEIHPVNFKKKRATEIKLMK